MDNALCDIYVISSYMQAYPHVRETIALPPIAARLSCDVHLKGVVAHPLDVPPTRQVADVAEFDVID